MSACVCVSSFGRKPKTAMIKIIKMHFKNKTNKKAKKEERGNKNNPFFRQNATSPVALITELPLCGLILRTYSPPQSRSFPAPVMNFDITAKQASGDSRSTWKQSALKISDRIFPESLLMRFSFLSRQVKKNWHRGN